MKLTEEQVKALSKHEDTLIRVRNAKRKEAVKHSIKKELEAIYIQVDTTAKGICYSCSDNWIKRLALWYINSKKSIFDKNIDKIVDINSNSIEEKPKRGRRPRIQ